MKDINVCKKCQYYEEDVTNLFDGKSLWMYERGFETRDAAAALHNAHWCRLGMNNLDNPEMEVGRIMLYQNDPQEFYKKKNTKDCPYYAEHMLHEMYNENKEVNYKFSRHFKKTRVCQHCGKEIPNRRHCDNCGYDWFKVFSSNRDLVLEHICDHAVEVTICIAILVSIGMSIFNIVTKGI